MNNKDTKELGEIKLASRSIKNTLVSLERTIKLVCYDHFDFLSSLAYYKLNNADDTAALEAKFEKHMNEYKHFFKKFSKFKTFKKLSLMLLQRDVSENMEFVFNHEENGEFIDRNKINKVVETITKFGRNVQVRFSFTTETHKDFEKLKNDVDALNEKLNKDFADSSELKQLLNKLIESCQNYQVIEHCDYLAVCGNILNNKQMKYSQKYLYKCVLKQQTAFVYEEAANENNDCSVCLEEFKNGTNVTKLKCGHVFCSECIEKWLSSSITCPCCRQSPEF